MKLVNFMLLLGLSAVFLVSGILKVVDIPRFSNAVAAFSLLPEQMVIPVAFYLPWLELLSGLSLLLVSWRRAGLILILGQLILFTGVLLFALAAGKTADCGCFGSLGGDSIPSALLRDVVLLITSLWLLGAAKTQAPRRN